MKEDSGLDEWEVTGRVQDLYLRKDRCEICNENKDRFRFEIENKETQESLMSCRNCILIHKIQVNDPNTGESIQWSWTFLNDLQWKALEKTLISQMEDIKKSSTSPEGHPIHSILEEAIIRYKKEKRINPLEWVCYIKLAIKKDLPFDSDKIKTRIRNKKNKEIVQKLRLEDLDLIWDFLPKGQQDTISKLREGDVPKRVFIGFKP